MNKAFFQIQVKSFDEHERVIRGIATTPTVDRMGDVVEPLGARFAASVPFLVGHRHDQVVGRVSFKKPTRAGIEFEAKLPKVNEPGPLRDRIETAWLELAYGLISSVSIGFRAMAGKFEALASGGIRYLEYEIMELSMVAVPAQQDAEILEVRAARARARARIASNGSRRVVKLGNNQPTKPRHVVVTLDPERSRNRFDAKMRALGVKVPKLFLTVEARAKWYRARVASAKARGVGTMLDGWDIR